MPLVLEANVPFAFNEASVVVLLVVNVVCSCLDDVNVVVGVVKVSFVPVVTVASTTQNKLFITEILTTQTCSVKLRPILIWLRIHIF